MKKSELKQIIKEEIQKVLGKDQYVLDVIDNLKFLSKKLNLTLKDEYWNEYSQSEEFKNMIETEKMNRKTPIQAAKSIISIWR
jgi:hypothetical protein